MGEVCARKSNADMRKRLAAELKRLGAQEDPFFDLVRDDDWTQEKIATRLRAIRDERARLARQLDVGSNAATQWGSVPVGADITESAVAMRYVITT